MAFDQQTRNRLAHFVADTRDALSNEFTHQLQHEYGMDPETGEVSDLSTLGHLDDSRRETAKLLRETMDHYVATSPSGGKKEALARIVREQAFTILNRLCAIRMAEARELVIESICKGYQSKGFQLYARLAGTALGERGDIYKQYLLSLFDEFAIDLPVLFDRFSPQGRLFPRENILLKILEEINSPDLESLWSDDETIGWIYQYFNSIEERRQMRAESQAPRNSRELAVRNQFFTPRYVVEFLTDNTLGRIWYEMRKGETALKEECRYLVRRPNEVFLKAGENAPGTEGDDTDLSQEELLKKTVYIEHRPNKDPRDLKVLDPACGSGHFLLYSFDLLEKIYREAWEDENSPKSELTGKMLRQDYSALDDLTREIPKLIVENNLYGIEIDPRCAQIAGLCLWLRAQKSWKDQGLKAAERPQIKKSGIVVAEPMPGEEHLKKEFLDGLRPKVLGQLVEVVFNKMKLAGEAGSLLKIEEEINSVVAKAKEQWQKAPKAEQEELFALPKKPKVVQEQLFDLSGVTDEQFWDEAEEHILDSLHQYSTQAENGNSTSRRLFANDAARGFAFIDLCRKRYDVVLMNPPFGAASEKSKSYLEDYYGSSVRDLAVCFIDRALIFLSTNGETGALTTRTLFFLKIFAKWRKSLINDGLSISVLADFGRNVLDAAVEVSATVFSYNPHDLISLRLLSTQNKADALLNAISTLPSGNVDPAVNCSHMLLFEPLPDCPFLYWVPSDILSVFTKFTPFESNGRDICQGAGTTDDFRFLRFWWEVPAEFVGIGRHWIPFAKGGSFSPFYSDLDLVVKWTDDGRELKELTSAYRASKGWSPHWTAVLNSHDKYFNEGITFPSRPHQRGRFSCLPSESIFSVSGMAVFAHDQDLLSLLGILNSDCYQGLVHLLMPRGTAGGNLKYELGYLRSVPVPIEELEHHDIESLKNTTLDSFYTMQSIRKSEETDHCFILPGLLLALDSPNSLGSASEHWARIVRERLNKIETNFNHLSTVCARGYGFDQTQVDYLRKDLTSPHDIFSSLYADEHYVPSLVSWLLGVAFARWDIRLATGTKPQQETLDPFVSLPRYSPGMTTDSTGSDSPKRDNGDYQLLISKDGILVSDESHTENIEFRLRQILISIWGDQFEAIEKEVVDNLGVNVLSEYFAKTGLFFENHLRQYSKSRRVAPIYWPLSTASGSYTLWLYYHRLTDQTLFTCVNDYVEPKLKQISQEASRLRQKSSRSSSEERELTRLSDLELELEDFRDELLRLSKFWKPNLNDGVQITAAPLWKLFQHRQWQNKIKDTWKGLEKGDYDWAHLAYSIWPDRVKEKCKKDKSLAIAHGMEDLYVEPQPKAKKSKAKK